MGNRSLRAGRTWSIRRLSCCSSATRFYTYGLPGAGWFAAVVADRLSTQSPASGGVKFLFPKVAKFPIKLAVPEEGLNHQQVAYECLL